MKDTLIESIKIMIYMYILRDTLFENIIFIKEYYNMRYTSENNIILIMKILSCYGFIKIHIDNVKL